MSEHNITVEGGSSVRLKTAGKYCDRDIVVTATGSSRPAEDLDAVLTEQETLIATLQATLESKAVGGETPPATISGSNLHDESTDAENAYISNSQELEYTGWTATDYILLEAGKYYYIYSTSVIDPKYCSKFDADKKFVTAFVTSVNSTDKSEPSITPGHGGYIRLSGVASAIKALEIYEVVNFKWEVSE